MDRKEIKAAAKEKIKGNKWNIIWPALVISVLSSLLEQILGVSQVPVGNAEMMENYQPSPMVGLGIMLIGLLVGILTVCYKKYILNFIKTGKFEFNDIIDCLKEKWLNILIASILTSIIIFGATLLFVIPGIIMSFAYAMVAYIVVDTDTAGSDSLKASREMMKGYKWNYFVFGLSFIGWYLLVPFTLGILLIWLYPYYTVADAMYYLKLKEITDKK